MLIVFDNDGTICDTQEVEGRCYAEAIRLATGLTLQTLDWTRYEEPTSSAVVRQLLADDPEWRPKEDRIKAEFCRLLREDQPKYPGDFTPLRGAVEFLNRLQAMGHTLAIATGAFDTEARFKLQCCGVNLDDFPHATSSDTPRRADIIALAIERAGGDTAETVYFGDGAWDVKCCAKLGLRMIGIGRRHEHLRSLGIRHTFRDYSVPEAILVAIRGTT